jgi:hypothetical protein
MRNAGNALSLVPGVSNGYYFFLIVVSCCYLPRCQRQMEKGKIPNFCANPSSALTSYVTLDNSPHLSEPQCPPLSCGDEIPHPEDLAQN